MIGLSVFLIVLFAYSAWVDRPQRVRQLTQQEIPSRPEVLQTRTISEPESARIVVRILNGNGTSGVAYKLREYLINQGYDVSETTNADHFNYENSIIYLHTRDYSMSNKLARTLGIDNNPVLDDRAPDYPCNITLVMGKDYKKLPPFLENN